MCFWGQQWGQLSSYILYILINISPDGSVLLIFPARYLYHMQFANYALRLSMQAE